MLPSQSELQYLNGLREFELPIYNIDITIHIL